MGSLHAGQETWWGVTMILVWYRDSMGGVSDQLFRPDNETSGPNLHDQHKVLKQIKNIKEGCGEGRGRGRTFLLATRLKKLHGLMKTWQIDRQTSSFPSSSGYLFSSTESTVPDEVRL